MLRGLSGAPLTVGRSPVGWRGGGCPCLPGDAVACVKR